jgi:hypothetical protein
MVVGGVTRLTDGALPVRRGVERRTFAVSVDRGSTAERTVASNGVSMVSLLAMQEAESEAQQDREARQHGEAMMEELSELQRALLGTEGPDLTRLAELAARPITACDPMLAGVLRAIRVRAGVELARWDVRHRGDRGKRTVTEA